MERLKWQGWGVKFCPLSSRQAGRLARKFGVNRPRPGYEVKLCDLPLGRSAWLANQVGDLSWVIGESAWGKEPYVAKII